MLNPPPPSVPLGINPDASQTFRMVNPLRCKTYMGYDLLDITLLATRTWDMTYPMYLHKTSEQYSVEFGNQSALPHGNQTFPVWIDSHIYMFSLERICVSIFRWSRCTPSLRTGTCDNNTNIIAKPLHGQSLHHKT